MLWARVRNGLSRLVTRGSLRARPPHRRMAEHAAIILGQRRMTTGVPVQAATNQSNGGFCRPARQL